MQYAPIYLDETESKALLDSGSADALFVYLFLRNGNDIHSANEPHCRYQSPAIT